MSGEALHSQLDEIERIHGLYSPAALGLASALACGAFTFLLGRWPAGNDPGFCRAQASETPSAASLASIILLCLCALQFLFPQPVLYMQAS